MTRKKSNVKALALAVTCAILAGGGIGLEPVYAAEALYKEASGNVTTATKNGETDNTIINELTVGGVTIGGSGAITADSLALNGIGDIKTAIEGKAAQADVENNKNNIANLQTKTTKISYNATTGTTVEGAITATGNITANGGLSAANGRFTVKASGETVVKGANGKVTINNSGINIAQKELGTNKDLSITLDSGYVDASGYVKAPKFFIDNDNGFVKEADGKSRLTVSDVDETGAVTNSVKIGGGNILASGDVNVAGTLCTNTILNATHGEGVTVDGVKFKAGAVSGVKSINGKIEISADGKTVTFNRGETNGQVEISAAGIKVGTGSTYIKGDAIYTGDANYDNAKAGMKSDGSLKAADGKFTVNGTNGETVVTGTAGTTTITGGGVTISKASSGEYVSISEGSVFATDSIKAVNVISAGLYTRIKDGKVVAKNGLYVGYSSTDITGATYDNSKFAVDGNDGSLKAANGNFTVEGATGNTTVGGTLSVAGETTFANGIKTDTIVEKTANAGVTVNGNKITTDNKFNDVELKNGNVNATDITANGALKGKTLGIGTNGTEFTVNADGEVQAAGGKVSIDKTGKATFGYTAGNITTIEGQKITTGSIVATDTTVASNISGVQMLDGKITASNMEITGAISLNDLTVNNKLTVGAFSVDKNGVVAGVKSINGANVTASGTGLTIGSATVGAANPFSSTGFTVDANGNVAAQNITAGTYNGNTIGADNKFNGVELKGGDVKATKVTADTITDGTATMTGGTVTANAITANTSASLAGVTFDASGVDFNNKEIKNIAKVTATTADLGNLHIEGANITNRVDPTGGAIGLGTTVTVNNAGELGGIKKIDGVSVGAVTGNGLQFGGNAVIGATGKPFSSTGFEVDGAGNVTGKSFKVNGSNYLDSTGLTTEKAVIGGVNTLNDKGIDTSKNLHVGGQATFGDSTGTHTTINGGTITSTNGTDTTTIGPNKITTKTLDVEDIILRNEMKDGTGATINIKGSDGSMSVAKGKFKVDDKGQVTNHITATGAAAADTIFTTSEIGIDATFQKTGETASSGLKIDYNHAALNASGGAALDLKDKTATLGIGTDSLTTYTSDTIKSKVGSTTVTTKSGGTTFGDGTANNTLINGSSITSTKDGTFTTINGSSVRSYNSATGAGHLNGATLNLWKDSDNATYMTAGGATFTKDGKTTIISGDTITTGTLNVKDIVLGGTMYDATGHPLDGKLSIGNDGHLRAANGNFDVKDDGTFKNTVGNTTLQTDTTGASMKFDNTATTGGIKSEVAVADDSAKISAGASSIEVKNDGITNNGVTTFNGTTGTTTKIDGGTITTNHLITDKLTITGSGNAEGLDPSDPDYRGSIAFGGNGSITSNIKDGTKEVTFKTDKTGTFTEAKDGSNVTTNTVNAQGNTNVVTDGTNTSTATQTATSIGGVVTNGTVKMSQELTADGVKFEQTGYDEVNIAKGDVTVKNNRNTATPNQEVHLSDLGSLNNLDGELAARDEYTDNKTAVGAINAEAGIRREEVTRLDGRINDVNDRVNKVGAMAAAIASLKSIGYDPQAPSEFSIGLGQYKGETGVAMGFFHYPNKNFMINVSLSTAGGETMGGIGATWRFGHKSPQKLLEEQREAQAKKELAAAEKYQAAAKLAKEAQERAEYAAKLARQAQVSADNAKAAADATQAKHFG